jgi:hypothetical protein
MISLFVICLFAIHYAMECFATSVARQALVDTACQGAWRHDSGVTLSRISTQAFASETRK